MFGICSLCCTGPSACVQVLNNTMYLVSLFLTVVELSRQFLHVSAYSAVGCWQSSRLRCRPTKSNQPQTANAGGCKRSNDKHLLAGGFAPRWRNCVTRRRRAAAAIGHVIVLPETTKDFAVPRRENWKSVDVDRWQRRSGLRRAVALWNFAGCLEDQKTRFASKKIQKW